MLYAAMYGSGKIGRGFVGAILHRGGLHIDFIDINMPMLERLNADGKYPVRVVNARGFEDEWIDNLSGVDGHNMAAVAESIARADIACTSVGVGNLKDIAPFIVAGLRKRFEVGALRPLNILICENLVDSSRVLGALLRQHMTPVEQEWLGTCVGLVEVSIGIMVPAQHENLLDGNPLRILVERYTKLPVSQDCLVGKLPEIPGVSAHPAFDFYVKRKIYLYNMGHAVCAYLGMYAGIEYIYEAINTPIIRLFVHNAQLESALSLAKCFDADMGALSMFIDDLHYRFGNPALMDTCVRVGADPLRKLSPADRLVGSASMCLRERGLPVFICVGIAAALWHKLVECEDNSTAAAREVLRSTSAITDSELMGCVLSLYGLFHDGATLETILAQADALRSNARGGAGN